MGTIWVEEVVWRTTFVGMAINTIDESISLHYGWLHYIKYNWLLPLAFPLPTQGYLYKCELSILAKDQFNFQQL